MHDATAALEEALRVEKAARASESARNDERAREAGEEKTRLHARILEIQALEPRAEQIQTVGTENVESFLIESRVCTLYVYCMSAPRL